MAPGLVAFIVIASIIGALLVADIILYFSLDTGVTKKVVETVQTRSGCKFIIKTIYIMEHSFKSSTVRNNGQKC